MSPSFCSSAKPARKTRVGQHAGAGLQRREVEPRIFIPGSHAADAAQTLGCSRAMRFEHRHDFRTLHQIRVGHDAST